MSNRRKDYEKARNIANNTKTKMMKRHAKAALITGLLGEMVGGIRGFGGGRKFSATAGVNKYKKPHQGVEECRRRRERMGTKEYAFV